MPNPVAPMRSIPRGLGLLAVLALLVGTVVIATGSADAATSVGLLAPRPEPFSSTGLLCDSGRDRVTCGVVSVAAAAGSGASSTVVD